jgi:menaquinone-dependent protoporphyrinogen oxidase
MCRASLLRGAEWSARSLSRFHIDYMDKPLAIVYATWHGQAEKVARRIADVAYMNGVQSTVAEARSPEAHAITVESHSGAIVIGSVHFGRHPSHLRDFVTAKLAVLSTLPSAFLSVCGAAASLSGDKEARAYIHKFLIATGWDPDIRLPVAGAIPYSKYGFFMRHLMQFSSRVAGRDSDTSQDYEYTDWFTVEEFVRNFLAEVGLGRKLATAPTQVRL